ncbi:U3 snoRNP protein, partial [Saguinus oedipus]
MPPERRRRMKLDRRTGAKPKRKPGTRPDWKARAGPGGPPQKAARSSQRKPPARPSAAAAAIAVAAAEEERRLRQRNRLTLEEDKPAVERCLEELVFGDVEDDEDELLRRLRGRRVREAAARGLGALGRGARWAVKLRGAEPGRPAPAGSAQPENASAKGRSCGSLDSQRWTESLWRAGTAPFSAPGGAAPR